MLYDSELARRENGRIELRPGGLRVKWTLDDLSCADGHRVDASLSCTIRAMPSATERKMLEEAFLASRPVATTADVATHFAGALDSAAKQYARSSSAQSLLSDAGRSGLMAALCEAGKAVAFGCGVEWLPPINLELDSPTLALEQANQRRTAEQADQLRHSAELFKQFQSIRASAPELSPGQILQRIGGADQAEMLRSLLLTSAGKSGRQKLWAVAGSHLIQIPTEGSGSPGLVLLPPILGPVRSVQADSADHPQTLLVGCRSGVLRVDPARPDAATIFQDASIKSQQGFNAAMATADGIWASHGEAGLVFWPADRPAQPDHIAPVNGISQGAFSPRNLAGMGSGLVLSAGGQVVSIAPDGSQQSWPSPTPGDIAAIFVQPHRIVTAHEDGLICTRTIDEMRLDCQQRRSGRITSAAALPWLGDLRLLLATEDGPILCVGPDDELVTQYASPHRGLRIVAGSSDTVAAVTSDRQRLILWHSWDGRKPFAEIYLYGIAKHRVADIAFA